MKSKLKSKPLSLLAYAKRRGVSAEGVRKAIAGGRLRESVLMVGGKPKIADPELADREWASNTRPRVDQPAAAALASAPPTTRRAADDVPEDVPDYMVSRARREAAAARREAAQAELAELEVDERRGELVPVDEVRDHITNKFTVVRTRILGVPSRMAQRLPHIAAEIAPVAEELLREALTELSDDDSTDDADDDCDDEDDDIGE